MVKSPARVPRTAAWFNGENFRKTVEKSIAFGAIKKEFPKTISVNP
jgi:hypothetical protein